MRTESAEALSNGEPPIQSVMDNKNLLGLSRSESMARHLGNERGLLALCVCL